MEGEFRHKWTLAQSTKPDFWRWSKEEREFRFLVEFSEACFQLFENPQSPLRRPIKAEVGQPQIGKAHLGMPLLPTYILARKRLLLELLYLECCRGGVYKARNRAESQRRFASIKPKLSPLEWASGNQERISWLIWRFREWQYAAHQSWLFFIQKQMGTARPTQGRFPVAQIKFTMFTGKRGLLPRHVQQFLYDRFPFGNVDAERFALLVDSNLGKKCPAHKLKPSKRWRLSTWLIEIWPVVTAYDWTYPQVLHAFEKKFPEQAGDVSVSQTEDRCKHLGLRLSTRAEKKHSYEAMPDFPRAWALACEVISIAEDPLHWLDR